MSKVTTPAQVTKVQTMADGSVQIVLNTQELRGEQMAALFDLKQQQGWFLFAPNELQEKDIPKENADPETGKKSQCQRIRAVLYRLWEQKGKEGDFETFYNTRTERVIEHVKEQLE